ncbi:DICT sensory domain-containing protein [Amycolatopsis sp. 195334CR]|uniref:DICT sensory domain-containing protein n=1 Tax=Amycolatopsis sp. 195334CR TaxID=2814588 RepID=UPI001A8C5823|nr:DICT sensory domain-containing protein [Amycolatopsis sp. 195334CR]MBN6039019.1 sensor protein [Amycolatopsis sp. 195334CR]
MTAPSYGRAGRLTKRALVIASHTVERAALADGALEQAVVIAMFQRLPYFEREKEVYARIAQRASVTVVGMVERSRPDLPAGVTPVLLRANEELAREWSVVVLSPSFGAAVIAQDLNQVDPGVVTLEAAREFDGRWGMRRDEAYAEVVRLREALGNRLPPVARNRIDAVLESVTSEPAVDVEQRTEDSLRYLVTRLVDTRNALTAEGEQRAAERGEARDPATGLHTLDGLRSWLGTDTDTVGLGVTLLRVADLRGMEYSHGARAAMHTEQNIADLLRANLRPMDRAARLSDTDFLLVQPCVGEDELDHTGQRLLGGVHQLSELYPFVAVTPACSSTVTYRRPLPIESLRAALVTAPAPLWPPHTGMIKPAPEPAMAQRMPATERAHWFS